MAVRPLRVGGFTLIELMVTLTVVIVLLLIAVPSFQSFRQRAALRTATEQVMSFWSQARLEAAKRNQMVKVGVRATGGSFCLGAATTNSASDSTLCDCSTAGACNVATYPATSAAGQADWNGVTLAKVTIGTSNYPTVTTNKPIVIDPNRAFLTELGDAGVIQLAGPAGQRSYLVNFSVNGFGQARLCESNAAVDKMSDYGQRRCDP